VLEAAGELFLDKGFEATSTADIAEKVGILRGSIYYYMESKEGLLFELLENAYEGFTAAMDDIRGSEGDALTKLHALIEQHVLYLAESRIATTLFLTEARSLSPEHQAIVARHEESYRRGVVELVRGGQREGTIRDDVDPDLATMLFLGAANWTHRWYGRRGRASAEKVAHTFATVICDGLRPAM
jgi:TetR/AcrR family transcriptional regulator, cholesterol catabolism regulator